MLRRLPATAWPLLGVVVGVAAAALVAVLQDPVYRADASLVLVREGQPPGSDPELAEAAEAAAALFESRAVAASALANLGLDESPDAFAERVDAEEEPESSLVRIVVEAGSEEEARRAAQEVSEVATVLFNDRFGPKTVASVWEPAGSDAEQVSPRAARLVALGALFGALAGWALLLSFARRPPREPRPKRAPRPRREPAPGSDPGSDPGSVPVRDEPVAEPLRERPGSDPGSDPAAATGPFVLPAFGEWTIGDVERLVAEQGDAFPERREEIELYLETLRTVAGLDGRLPGDVDLVIEDVYADLIARAGSTRRG